MKVTVADVRAVIAGLAEPFTIAQVIAGLQIEGKHHDTASALVFHMANRSELTKEVKKGEHFQGGRVALFTRAAAFGEGCTAAIAQAEPVARPPSEALVILQNLALAWDSARIAGGRMHIGRAGHVVLAREEHGGL